MTVNSPNDCALRIENGCCDHRRQDAQADGLGRHPKGALFVADFPQNEAARLAAFFPGQLTPSRCGLLHPLASSSVRPVRTGSSARAQCTADQDVLASGAAGRRIRPLRQAKVNRRRVVGQGRASTSGRHSDRRQRRGARSSARGVASTSAARRTTQLAILSEAGKLFPVSLRAAASRVGRRTPCRWLSLVTRMRPPPEPDQQVLATTPSVTWAEPLAFLFTVRCDRLFIVTSLPTDDDRFQGPEQAPVRALWNG